MKVTIELSAAETKGIKAYLKEVDGDCDSDAVRQYIRNMVDGVIHAPQESVSDYIRQAETQSTTL